MPAGTKSPPERPLNSWKEIAQYFGREVRTVERWEAEEGLPVHRHMHHTRSSVYAYPAELEKWWRERGSKLGEAEREGTRARRSPLRLLAVAGVAVATVALAIGIWLSVRTASNPIAAPAYPTARLEGTRSHGHLGGALAGDLNGDGQNDLVLSARGAREVYVVMGGHLPARDAEFPAAADVVITGTKGREFGATQAADFNGDGIADLLLFEALDEPEAFRATGPSYILQGRREWPSRVTLPEAADVTIRLNWVANAQMMGCFSGAGPSDLSGDGIADVLLGASDYGTPGREAAGALYVLFGRREWPRELDPQSAADITLQGSRAGEGLGCPCAVGDFDGDAEADLLVHASEAKLWYLLGGRGRTYLFSGRRSWPRKLDAKNDFAFRVDNSHAKSTSVAPVLADVNGDGYGDLILGRPIAEERPGYGGEVQIWFGGGKRSGSAAADAADVVITGTVPGGKLGEGVASADFDFDGIGDLVVLQPGSGEVHLVYGRREWKKRGPLAEFAPVTLVRGEIGAGGATLALGDLDADGMPEVVFGYDDNGKEPGAKQGRARVLRPYLPVRVDVRPEDQPNVIVFPEGVSAARIYGFSRAEGEQIDPATVRQAGAAPTRHVVEDYNKDGIADLQVYFDNSKLRITLETKRVTLTARTRSGRLVAGTDSIVVTPSGAPAPGAAAAAKQIPSKR